MVEEVPDPDERQDPDEWPEPFRTMARKFGGGCPRCGKIMSKREDGSTACRFCGTTLWSLVKLLREFGGGETAEGGG